MFPNLAVLHGGSSSIQRCTWWFRVGFTEHVKHLVMNLCMGGQCNTPLTVHSTNADVDITHTKPYPHLHTHTHTHTTGPLPRTHSRAIHSIAISNVSSAERCCMQISENSYFLQARISLFQISLSLSVCRLQLHLGLRTCVGPVASPPWSCM